MKLNFPSAALFVLALFSAPSVDAASSTLSKRNAYACQEIKYPGTNWALRSTSQSGNLIDLDGQTLETVAWIKNQKVKFNITPTSEETLPPALKITFASAPDGPYQLNYSNFRFEMILNGVHSNWGVDSDKSCSTDVLASSLGKNPTVSFKIYEKV